MFAKPGVKILPLLIVLVAALALVYGYVTFNQVESSAVELENPHVTSISDHNVPNDDASVIKPDAVTVDVSSMLPLQSITFPVTVCVYLPINMVHTSIPVYTSTATPVYTFTVPVYTYTVVYTYPHDPDAFTQGLIFTNGVLYEGTGLRGRSSLRKVELETGSVLQIVNLPSQFFGEGVTIYDDKVIQLTWQSHAGFVYDVDSFELLRTFDYPTEGWGITHDGERLITSDGTATIYFWDPETFEPVRQIEVYDNDGPVVRLNELEYIRGEIYANVWKTNRIARIDPQTGRVLGWIQLQGLLSAADQERAVDVLNGIAYDAVGDRLFVTGKLWPTLFEIELVPLD